MLAGKWRKEEKYAFLILDLKQGSHGHLCYSGIWITQPLHQECNQRYSNILPRYSSCNCKKVVASGCKTSISCSQTISNSRIPHQVSPHHSSPLELFSPRFVVLLHHYSCQVVPLLQLFTIGSSCVRGFMCMHCFNISLLGNLA